MRPMRAWVSPTGPPAVAGDWNRPPPSARTVGGIVVRSDPPPASPISHSQTLPAPSRSSEGWVTRSINLCSLVVLVISGVWPSPMGTSGVAEASDPDSRVSFVSIEQRSTSGIVDPREIVIQSEPEWQALWRQHATVGAPLPCVDFATHLVVGIFAGQRPTSGYRVQIVSVEREHAQITVIYQIEGPAKDAIVAQVLTQPFLLIRLTRLGL